MWAWQIKESKEMATQNASNEELGDRQTMEHGIVITWLQPFRTQGQQGALCDAAKLQLLQLHTLLRVLKLEARGYSCYHYA